jgi:hypothetical protein
MGGSKYSSPSRDFLSHAQKEHNCEKTFDIELENVKSCEFFITNNFLPEINNPVSIEIRNQLCATINNQILGYLPKSANFLIKCINSGYSYNGIIILSQEKPIITIMVNISTKT